MTLSVPLPQRDAQDPFPGTLPPLASGRGGARSRPARWDTPPVSSPAWPVGHQRAPRTAGRVRADDRGPGWRPQWLCPGTGARVTPTAARGLAHRGFTRAQPEDRGSLRPLGKCQAPAKWGSRARTPQAFGQALEGSRWWSPGAMGPHTRAPLPAGQWVLPAWGMWSLRGCPGASETMRTPRPCPLLSSVRSCPSTSETHRWTPLPGHPQPRLAPPLPTTLRGSPLPHKKTPSPTRPAHCRLPAWPPGPGLAPSPSPQLHQRRGRPWVPLSVTLELFIGQPAPLK